LQARMCSIHPNDEMSKSIPLWTSRKIFKFWYAYFFLLEGGLLNERKIRRKKELGHNLKGLSNRCLKISFRWDGRIDYKNHPIIVR
jgi:hypothetical protein